MHTALQSDEHAPVLLPQGTVLHVNVSMRHVTPIATAESIPNTPTWFTADLVIGTSVVSVKGCCATQHLSTLRKNNSGLIARVVIDDSGAQKVVSVVSPHDGLITTVSSATDALR